MKTKWTVCFFANLLLAAVAFYAREATDSKALAIGQTESAVLSDKPLKGRIMVQAQEKLRIGSDALGKDAYFAIDDCSLSPLDRNVYLLDAKDFALHVFDAAGRHVRAIRITKGQGPGELEGRYPLFNRAYPREEGLWAEDYGKIVLFDHQGKLIREKRKAGTRYAQTQGISEGLLLVIRDELRSRPTDINRAFPVTQHLELENWGGESKARYLSSDKTGGWGNGWVVHVKDYRMTPLILFDYDSRSQRLVYAVSDEYTLTIADLSGKTLGTIRRYITPQKISREMRQAIMASPYFRDLVMRMKAMGQDLEKMMDLNQTWDHLNPIFKVQFLANGFICVFVLKDVQGRFEADVFDQEGRWQATLQFPETAYKLTKPRLQGNLLAGLVKDEASEEFFYLEYALKGIPPEWIQ